MGETAADQPTREGFVLADRGDRPCEVCGLAHDLWRAEGSTFYGSWADPGDGHIYAPESWRSLAAKWLVDHPVDRPQTVTTLKLEEAK